MRKYKFLIRHIPRLLGSINATTTIPSIISVVKERFGFEIAEGQAGAARRYFINRADSAQELQFKHIPAYCRRLEKEYSGTRAVYETHTVKTGPAKGEKRFQRVFVCPTKANRSSYKKCRPFVALDGTFLKTKWALTLLLAVGIDANNHIIILAWAVVESENNESWEWFANHLKECIPELVTEGATVISDRDKGLLNAIRALGASVVQAYCCFHLCQNLVKAKYGTLLLEDCEGGDTG